ncbi:MAG: Mobile element protein, partial [uncultured Thermomicrobiales bacterium]
VLRPRPAPRRPAASCPNRPRSPGAPPGARPAAGRRRLPGGRGRPPVRNGAESHPRPADPVPGGRPRGPRRRTAERPAAEAGRRGAGVPRRGAGGQPPGGRAAGHGVEHPRPARGAGGEPGHPALRHDRAPGHAAPRLPLPPTRHDLRHRQDQEAVAAAEEVLAWLRKKRRRPRRAPARLPGRVRGPQPPPAGEGLAAAGAPVGGAGGGGGRQVRRLRSPGLRIGQRALADGRQQGWGGLRRLPGPPGRGAPQRAAGRGPGQRRLPQGPARQGLADGPPRPDPPVVAARVYARAEPDRAGLAAPQGHAELPPQGGPTSTPSMRRRPNSSRGSRLASTSPTQAASPWSTTSV